MGTGMISQCFRALGVLAENLSFSQFTYRSSEQPVTPVPGDCTRVSCLHEQRASTHMICLHAHMHVRDLLYKFII